MSDPIIEAAARALMNPKSFLSYDEAQQLVTAVLATATPLIRAAALEEAAQVAHDHGRYSQAYLDGDLPDDVVIHNHTCWAIRDALRLHALKEQP